MVMKLEKILFVFAFGALLPTEEHGISLATISAFSFQRELSYVTKQNVAYSNPKHGSILKPLSLAEKEISSDDGDDHDVDDILSDSDQDWRTFRAKLVMSEGPSSPPEHSSRTQEGEHFADDSDLDGIGALFSDSAPKSTIDDKDESQASHISGFTPLDPSQWAYDSGKVVEKGAVILGGVEQDFGFGLRQQYFHKAVILVLDHDESTFTKGIILNRPSDRMMNDDVNTGLKWRVWFGGDVQGLDSLLPDIVCLHSLKSKEAREASVSVMKDIQWTSFANAKKLVQRGAASGPEDFWLFAGYAGWGPRQLASELDRKSWYMCATDSQTLLKELARQSSGTDPRDAGLDTWALLMNMIGRGGTATKCSGNFDDLILKEWGRANLLLQDKDQSGAVGMARNPLWGSSDGLSDGNVGGGSVDNLMKEAAKMALSKDIQEGSVLRGSSADRSPFLLQKQEFHKSLVLIILEDQKATVGVILNHPASKGYEIKSSKGSPTVPLRYGGDYAVKGQSPLLWLHCDQNLRDSGVGTPFGNEKAGIYKCSQEQATEAISYNIAKPQDFLIISGVCVWPKLGGSLANEVKRGVFEIVQPSKVEAVFRTLQRQEILSSSNLSWNVKLTHEAWEKGASGGSSLTNKNDPEVLTVGIGEGFDEDDDTLVFNSDKKVSELADDALRKWVATFLLGAPTL